MNGHKTYEKEKVWPNKFILGITFFPYQLSLGLTLRYLPGCGGFGFRFYFGPIKIWGGCLRKKENKNRNESKF